eukprot:2566340-Amphidinium_carterae.1
MGNLLHYTFSELIPALAGCGRHFIIVSTLANDMAVVGTAKNDSKGRNTVRRCPSYYQQRKLELPDKREARGEGLQAERY